MHLFGFILKKFVTMHGHMNVKNPSLSVFHQETKKLSNEKSRI